MFTGKFIIGLAAEVSIGCLFKTLALSQSTRMFFWKNNNRNLKHWKKLNTEENISHCAKVVVLKKNTNVSQVSALGDLLQTFG